MLNVNTLKLTRLEDMRMTNKKDPILVTIREKQTVEQALEEKKLEKDLKLIERIEKEENTKSENDEN